MPGHSKMKKMMKKMPKPPRSVVRPLPRAAVMPNLPGPRFGVSPPPQLKKLVKRRGMKNLMPASFRKNVKIH